MATSQELYRDADILVCVQRPTDAVLRPGQALVGLLDPLQHPAEPRTGMLFADAKQGLAALVTAVRTFVA